MDQPNAPSDYRGMTTNERLWLSGLKEDFSRAKSAKDISRMTQILMEVGFDEDTARITASESAKPFLVVALSYLKDRINMIFRTQTRRGK